MRQGMLRGNTGTHALLTLTQAYKASKDATSIGELCSVVAHQTGMYPHGMFGILFASACAHAAKLWPNNLELRPIDLRDFLRTLPEAWEELTGVTHSFTAVTASRTVAEFVETSTSVITISWLVGQVIVALTTDLVTQEEDDSTGIDAGTAVFLLMAACLADLREKESWEADNRHVDSAMELVSRYAAALDTDRVPVHPVSQVEFEVTYLFEGTPQDLKVEKKRIGPHCSRLAILGEVSAFGLGFWTLQAHTHSPLNVVRTGSATIRALARPLNQYPIRSASPLETDYSRFDNVIALAPKEDLRIPQLNDEETVGIIAVTRAPGLVESLARTGALVVFNPTSHDSISWALVSNPARHLVLFPCDFEALQLCTWATGIDADKPGTRTIASSQDEIGVLAGVEELSSWVGQPWVQRGSEEDINEGIETELQSFAVRCQTVQLRQATRAVQLLEELLVSIGERAGILHVILSSEEHGETKAVIEAHLSQRHLTNAEVIVRFGGQSGPTVIGFVRQ